MKLDLGTILIALSVVVFYARVLMLRNQKNREEREQSLAYVRARAKKKKNVAPPPQRNPLAPRFQIRSWWLVVPAVLLVLIGVYAYTGSGFIHALKPYYYLPITAGMLLISFSLK
jgi:heme/copper-type cytochrome/quinol oxidase subunit 2